MSPRLSIGWCLIGLGGLSCLPTVQATELPPVESVGGVELPAIPSSVASAAVEASAAAREQLTMEATESPVTNAEATAAIEVEPGTTELLRIARNYLNRLITPFEDPRVLTVNPVEVRKEGASVFLATSSEKPVGVHILSSDSEDTRGISLTLVPARIPPKTIELKWRAPSAEGAARAIPTRARRWEQSAPYVQKLLELAELVARGEVPPGYSLSTDGSGEAPCRVSGLTFEPGQRLTGSRFTVLVLRVTNAAAAAVELIGNVGCNVPGVALVAPWPDAHLAPGASTELYVIVINEAFEAQSRPLHRPSLLKVRP